MPLISIKQIGIVFSFVEPEINSAKPFSVSKYSSLLFGDGKIIFTADSSRDFD